MLLKTQHGEDTTNGVEDVKDIEWSFESQLPLVVADGKELALVPASCYLFKIQDIDATQDCLDSIDSQKRCVDVLFFGKHCSPDHGVCASRGGGGASDSRALPEYCQRPVCDGGGHCVAAGTPTQCAACACGV